jgi:hypothetical protein
MTTRIPLVIEGTQIEELQTDDTLNLSASTTVLAALFSNAAEVATISASAPASTTNYDVLTQSVQYYTSNTANNWTLNVRGSASVSLNTIMSTGQSITLAMLVTNSTTAYYNSAVNIDGTASGVTTKWQGGTAPTSGDVSSVNIYTYTIVKTASATYSVFASVVKFA